MSPSSGKIMVTPTLLGSLELASVTGQVHIRCYITAFKKIRGPAVCSGIHLM
jgi:hypothetical protein